MHYFSKVSTRLLPAIIACIAFPVLSSAQTITGEVIDMATGRPLTDVTIQNIFTHQGTQDDSSGHFSIAAAKGELVQFHKLGYKVAHVRIPTGGGPSYYKIIMQTGAYELDEFAVRDKEHNRSFQDDSVKNHEIYRKALDLPRMSATDVVNHPFSALSKQSRQAWAFQKEYAYFEQEKYVDYTFNERLVTNLTGLKGQEEQDYMRAYRPSYEMLHSLSEYDFYYYVKRTGEIWKQRKGL